MQKSNTSFFIQVEEENYFLFEDSLSAGSLHKTKRAETMRGSSFPDSRLASAANDHDDGVSGIFDWQDNDDRYVCLIQTTSTSRSHDRCSSYAQALLFHIYHHRLICVAIRSVQYNLPFQVIISRSKLRLKNIK